MRRKQLMAIAMAAVMAVGNIGISNAAVVIENGTEQNNRILPEKGWHKDAAGRWKYVDENGNYKTGWLQDTDGRWYYFNSEGIMQTGWLYDTDQKWYYLNDGSVNGVNGSMLANGWYWLDGNRDGTQECYYLGQSGVMYADMVTPDGYRVNKDGAWMSDNGIVQTRKVSGSQLGGGGSSSRGGGSSSGGGGSSSGGTVTPDDNEEKGIISVGKLVDQFVEIGGNRRIEVTAASSNHETVNLTVQSKNEEVAAASVNGTEILVEGRSEGITELTVTASAKNCETVMFTVIVAVVKADSPETEKGKITINGETNSTIRVGETKTIELFAEASNEAAVELKAESNAPTVAEVSIEGNRLKLKGVAKGAAVITILASANQCADEAKSFVVRVDSAIEEEDLFYGQENYWIVINAADALDNTLYAFCKDGIGSSAETSTLFKWKAAEDGKSVQLLAEDGTNPDESNEWDKESDSYSSPRLTYKVNVPESGEYYVSFYSNSPNIASDSFHIGTGTEPDSYTWKFTTKDQITNGSDNYGSAEGERWYVCNKKTISLKKGVNYIHVAARESGLLLRQISLSLQNPIFMENKWVDESKLVSGYLSLEVPEDDIELKYGEQEKISVVSRASNGEKVELSAVSGNEETVEISEDGRNSFVLDGIKTGNSTVTIKASADGYADVLGVFNVKVAEEQVSEGDEDGPLDLMVAPATEMSDSITLVWDKPEVYDMVTEYAVYKNDEQVGTTLPRKTHYTVENLEPDTSYKFKVAAVMSEENADEGKAFSATIIGRTREQGEVLDITKAPYEADSTGKSVSTEVVQRAIDECPEGGTVLIPEDAEILTGALDLKSNMTLQVDGTLQGTNNVEDYIITPQYRDHYPGLVNDDGMILTRYEGWEMYCYRSLLNAGYLNPENRREVTCENLTICGKGTIKGRGDSFGKEMWKRYKDKTRYPEYVSDGNGGRRLRGRLFGLIQCKNVHITDVTVKEPSCWTIHMIYCDTLTTHGVSINSSGVDNGDGWDPDSSRNMMIFDTTFNTGDDCISVKSGKNPDGNIMGMPSNNIRVFDLEMNGGHGMTVGSEQSGGVEGVYMRDCKINNTWRGLELKAHNSRGGYIKNVLVRDCEFDMFLAHTVDYNSDGTNAPDLPVFQGITFKDCVIDGQTMRNGGEMSRPVEIIGFAKDGHSDSEKEHYVNDVLFENVVIGNSNKPQKTVYLERCKDILFRNVTSYDGSEPNYEQKPTVINFKIEKTASKFSSTVEAEKMMELVTDGQESAFENVADQSASGETYRKLSAAKGVLEAIYNGKDEDTAYINVTCSNSGEGMYTVFVNDEELASWSSETVERWYTRSIQVPNGLKRNDVIRLEVEGAAGAAVKLDKLSVTGTVQTAGMDELADITLSAGNTAKHLIGDYTADGRQLTELTAASEDESIASVAVKDNEIHVTGESEGTTKVIVTAQAGEETLETTFEVTVSDEPINLALEKEAFAKSEENSSHSADKMVDGSLKEDDRWVPNGGCPQWIVVDLGAVYELEKVNFVRPAGHAARTYSYQIYGTTELNGTDVESQLDGFDLLAEFEKYDLWNAGPAGNPRGYIPGTVYVCQPDGQCRGGRSCVLELYYRMSAEPDPETILVSEQNRAGAI